MRNRSLQRGFTLLELLFAVSITAVAVIGGLLFVGRHIIDNVDAVRAVPASAALVDPKVVERHEWFPTRHGCTADHADAFVVEGKTEKGETKRFTVCCGAWFGGCQAKP